MAVQKQKKGTSKRASKQAAQKQGTHKKKIDGKENRRNRQSRIRSYLARGLAALLVLFAVLLLIRLLKPDLLKGKYKEQAGTEIDAVEPEIDVQLLTVNPYSRPGIETDKITGIVIHYTANPGSTAMNNRDYFEGLKDSHENQVSSNFVVGLEGEIVQCVPTWEVAYASNERNHDTVSIECCHSDETGQFNDATYRSVVQLTAWLCLKFGLDEKDVIRHYDITGKNCPKYFVEHEEAWEQFREDVRLVIEKGKDSQ